MYFHKNASKINCRKVQYNEGQPRKQRQILIDIVAFLHIRCYNKKSELNEGAIYGRADFMRRSRLPAGRVLQPQLDLS